MEQWRASTSACRILITWSAVMPAQDAATAAEAEVTEFSASRMIVLEVK
jgi:hypothetical protein